MASFITRKRARIDESNRDEFLMRKQGEEQAGMGIRVIPLAM